MSIPTGGDDAYWQRPDEADDAARPEPRPAKPPEPPYPGPPRTEPPPPHWRPPVVAQPPPPRDMPAQDLDALAEAEGSARTVTYGVGLVAGAIAVIIMCLLCARIVF
ncbi:translation initiation factor 2 [Actinoplanes sp. NPDC051633]|uniref:translation initiation factor 2 n=1 Tax=Actinoplanes sp. NPDC051633 TaxID=3155670 RepID=UPI003430E3CE